MMCKEKPTGLRRGRAHGAWEWLKSGLVGFGLFIVVRTFLIQTFAIVSGSMEGTLLVGDFLVLNKVAYGATVPILDTRLPGYDEPGRGDIVVFVGYHDPVPLDLVKRIVGLPGDTLEMRDAVLALNGVPVHEDYVTHDMSFSDHTDPSMRWQTPYLANPSDASGYRPTRDNWGPIIVPEGKYFVLGDNRNASRDSRYWGFVNHAQIKGRAAALYFSYDARSSQSGVPVLSRIRWNRIGNRVE